AADSTAHDRGPDPDAERPRLTNRAHIARLLEQYYPPDLRRMRRGGVVHVWFYIDEDGAVTFKEVTRTSGECKLDASALLVSRSMRFEPAVSHGERVPVWVALPVVFSSR